jgi:hypothetical protein
VSKYRNDVATPREGRVIYDGPSAMRDRFQWARLLAFVTGLVNQELLLRNEYLVAENLSLSETSSAPQKCATADGYKLASGPGDHRSQKRKEDLVELRQWVHRT